MDHRELAELALSRDIGELKQPPKQGVTVCIGETGWRKSDPNSTVLGLPDWCFPVDAIPLDDGTVKLIHAYHFLEHLTGHDAIKFLVEAQRVLKVGGILQYGIPYYKSELASQDLTHKSFWTESSFKMLLENDWYNPLDQVEGIDPEFKFTLKIQSQCIIGVVERNLMLIGQLIKTE